MSTPHPTSAPTANSSVALCVPLNATDGVEPTMPAMASETSNSAAFADTSPVNLQDLEVREAVFERAAQAFIGESNKFKCERAFTELLQDFIDHWDQWDLILSLDLSEEVVECSSGILSTLAVLHRQRQNLDECDRVLDVYQRILKHYRAIAMRPRASQERRDSFWNHVYRQNHIRVNLAVNRHEQLHDMSVLRASIAPLLRDLVAYEMDHNVPPQKQSYKFMYLGRQSSGRSDLQDMSDNELFAVYWETVKRLGADTGKVSLTQQRLIELKECAHCHSYEPTRGDFSACGGCKKIHYCGAECQRKHWRAHKVACNQATAAEAKK